MNLPKPFRYLAMVVAVIAAVVILKDFVPQSILTSTLSKVLGAPVKVGSFHLNLFKGSVDIKDFRILNPRDFEKHTLVNAERIHIEVDPRSLFKGKIHIHNLEMKIREVMVVKNQKGELSANALRVASHKKEAEGETSGSGPRKPLSESLKVDQMKLSIGRVVVKDYSGGSKPVIEVYDLNLRDARYEGLTSSSEIVQLILLQSLQSTALKGALVFGASLATGVGILPIGAAVILTGNADAQDEFDVSTRKAFDAAVKAATELGTVVSKDEKKAVIEAEIAGCNVSIQIKDQKSKTLVHVSARRLLVPQPKIAAGVLYQVQTYLD